jgi:hypothetical protein
MRKILSKSESVPSNFAKNGFASVDLPYTLYTDGTGTVLTFQCIAQLLLHQYNKYGTCTKTTTIKVKVL